MSTFRDLSPDTIFRPPQTRVTIALSGPLPPSKELSDVVSNSPLWECLQILLIGTKVKYIFRFIGKMFVVFTGAFSSLLFEFWCLLWKVYTRRW